MSQTPWGDVSQLRGQTLRPGPGHSPELVARNQRERLLAAAMVAIADRGYEQTPVADILKLSGVSRTTFYQHFPGGKEECFLAAVEAGVATGLDSVTQACEGTGAWEDRIARGLDALTRTLIDQPAAARLCLVEIHSAGPEGLAHAERAAASFGWLLNEALADSPERAAVPPAITAALGGGIRKILESRVNRGELAALPELVPDLCDWVTSYRNPSAPIRRPRSRPPLGSPARMVANDQVERIFGGVATAVAEKGYPATTLDDIVKNASASLTTFYQHFDGKEEAFVAAYDTAMAQATAAAMPPYRWSRSWPLAVRAALEAFLAFFAAEPRWARIAMVDVLTAGGPGLEHRDRAFGLFEEILQPGYEHARDMTPLAVEAIGGAIHWMIYEQIQRRGAEHLSQILPAVTFVALAPFVGSEEASAVANRNALRTRGRGGETNGQVLGRQGRTGGEAPGRRPPRSRGH
jgi:AcrR family transcriptional regulator